MIFFMVVFFAKIVVFCKSLTITPYTLIKSSETIVVAIKILDLDPLQQYYHLAHSTSPHSTTLALKNFFPNAPFGFLNSLYLYASTSRAMLDANSTNLFRCSVSWSVVGLSCTKASVKFPLQWRSNGRVSRFKETGPPTVRGPRLLVRQAVKTSHSRRRKCSAIGSLNNIKEKLKSASVVNWLFPG